MALRATLNEIVEQVRNECRLSTNSSRGLDHRDYIVQLIRRHYASLAEDFDWEHLQLKRDSSTARKNMAAGSRYYDFPTTLNVQKIERAWVRWGAEWFKLDYGVRFSNYSVLDSDDSDNRSDHVEQWDFYGHNQFEVWPIPATTYTADNGYQVAFEGQRTIEQLNSDTSRADLDDILIVLNVSAEILASNDKETEAKIKLVAAENRMATLKGNLADKGRYRIGLGRAREGARGWPRYPEQIR